MVVYDDDVVLGLADIDVSNVFILCAGFCHCFDIGVVMSFAGVLQFDILALVLVLVVDDLLLLLGVSVWLH